MVEKTAIHQDTHIGVAKTTPTHVKRMDDGTFKARCGIAIMGAVNMNEKEFEDCGYDPFHSDFRDNFAEGEGPTEEKAVEALKKDMQETSDSLWAF